MDPAYEEAAQKAGASAWRASSRHHAAGVAGYPLGIGSSCFSRRWGAFGARRRLGTARASIPLTTKIYELFSYPPRFELAAGRRPDHRFTVLGLLCRCCAARPAFHDYRRQARRSARGGSRQGALAAVRLVHAGRLCQVVLPLVILCAPSLMARWGLAFSWENLTLANYASFASASTIVPTAFFNSAMISAVAASACVVLGMIVVWIVERTSLPGRGF
jgi:iron(III) transport system permease protein